MLDVLHAWAFLRAQLDGDVGSAAPCPSRATGTGSVSCAGPSDGLASDLGIANQCANKSATRVCRGGRASEAGHCNCTAAGGRVQAKVSDRRWRGSGSDAIFHVHLAGGNFSQATSDLRFCDVILISRQSHSSQDTNDRHNDHQFDKGETLLHVACDGTTVHSKTPGWLYSPGTKPGAQYLPQHLCHPLSRPCTDETGHLVRTQVTSSDTNCDKALRKVTNLSCQPPGDLKKSAPHPPSTTGYPAAPARPPDARPAAGSGS
jgi:hypothetical protein